MAIVTWIGLMVERSASDLHLVSGQRPALRVHGSLSPVAEAMPLSGDEITTLLEEMVTSSQMEVFRQQRELDFRYEVPEGPRLRGNAAWQRGVPYVTLRLIPARPPHLDELGLPAVCETLVLRPRGLIVVAGATNSGKSTTLAAMVEQINSNMQRRIITIEDPVEYVFESRSSLITQRELGPDTESFAQALRAAMRQDPNVLLVGEMRDLETISAALTAAETGQLVLATIHAPSAPQVVDRIVDVFPAHQQQRVRVQLAATLEAALYQVLLPRRDGPGRAVAVEVLLGTTPVRALIREGKGHQIHNAMFTGAADGMRTLNQALAEMCQRGSVSREVALANSSTPDDLMRLLSPSPLPV